MTDHLPTKSQEIELRKARIADLEKRESILLERSEHLQNQIQKHREAELKLLKICHLAKNINSLMHDLVNFFKELTGCEAVAVRLRQGEDFPYYETKGFPQQFVKSESTLCVRDPLGNILRDPLGNPILECMCGNILSGRFDPALPFFTANGSFLTNSTSELLASTSEADRQARTRNRCHGEGYESVALIPMRIQETTFGLFQFNDQKNSQFTPSCIKQLEDLVDYVAIALSKHLADEELRISEEKYRLLVENARVAIIVTQNKQLILVNPAATDLTGYSNEELTSRPFTDFIHADDREMVLGYHLRRLQGRDVPNTYCFRVICRSGEIKWVEQKAQGLPGMENQRVSIFSPI